MITVTFVMIKYGKLFLQKCVFIYFKRTPIAIYVKVFNQSNT
uniref:Uncharacterized protein n=1 Tax=Anguilla anguilla TaxID=7936 RepID=A0A0E9WJV2_ANGAN